MSVLIPNNLSFFFNSDAKSGAVNKSDNGASFSVILNTPLQIPKSAVSCDLHIQSSAITYNNPNISAELKNNTFTFTTTSAPAGTYTLIIPDGLYSIEALNQAISNAIVNLTLPFDLFTLSGDFSTQSSIITFQLAGDSVDFTTADNLRFILGFDALVYTSPSPNYNQYSPNTASFNTDSQYLILSDLLSYGIPVNARQNGILTNIPITGDPGTVIYYEPNNPVAVNASELIGASKLNMRFTLTNQNLVPVNTVGENWSFTMVITYYTLLTNEKVPIMPR